MRRRSPPGRMLARLLPLMPRFGVTRLAVLTGLDVLGIPVAGAVRPNSRTVAVHQGKGASLAQAKVSALMEALECFCAETQTLPLRLATVAELDGAALDVTRLPRCAGGPDPTTVRLLWVAGRLLGTDLPVWVPRELVAADYAHPPAPDSGVFQATTNGLASGATRGQAILHGLCEAIERDAITLWQVAGASARATRLLDAASVSGARSRFMLDRCRAGGAEVAMWDVTSDIGVPVFAALLVDPQGRVQPELGCACRADADTALAAALAEAAQARVTTISGARDDLLPESFEHAAMGAREAAAAAMQGGGPRQLFVPRDVGGDDPIGAIADLLARAGCGRPAVVSLTRAELGVPVVRVVVPGLEGPYQEDGGEFLPGARARGAPSWPIFP